MVSKHHPVNEIRRIKGDMLLGKRILLGVSASTACYKTVDLARELIKLGAEVKVALTREALKYISPDLFHWATGQEPILELSGETEHVQVAKAFHALLIAPATVNIVAKIANGIADEPLSLIALSAQAYNLKRYIIPSAHIKLLRTPQHKENMDKLTRFGWYQLEPDLERYRFPDPEIVAWWLASTIDRGEDLRGYKFIVTGGATASYIDEIRMITNPSSGKMGFMLGLASTFRGAISEVVLGYTDLERSLPSLRGLAFKRAYTNHEMLKLLREAVSKAISESSLPPVVIMAAAPTDFKAKQLNPQGKLDSEKTVSLTLIPEVKIAKALKEEFKDNIILIGFTAHPQREDLIEIARAKLRARGFDLIFANHARGHSGGESAITFGSQTSELIMVSESGVKELGRHHKLILANLVLDEVREIFLRGRGDRGEEAI